MTDYPSPPSKKDEATPKKMSPATLLTLLVIPLLLVGAGWVFWQQLQATPAREVGISMRPYGILVVRLTTEPFPATTTGPVLMTLLMQAPGGSTVTLDRVTYQALPPDGGEPLPGEAQPVGRNTYQGILRFDQVGDWQVLIEVEKDGRVNQGTITVPVKPAL